MAAKVRWGVLGYARIARESVIPAIKGSSNAELHALASRGAESREECRAKFGCPKTYASYDELLGDPEVDAVYIPLPNSMHCEWTVKAAESGKHVLCEKPLAPSAAEAKRMIEACTQKGVFLMEAFMYRYSDRTAKVREILESGALGEIKYVESCYRFSLTRENTIKMRPELGGGSLLDVGCYPVSFVGMVTGASPVSLKAEAVFKDGVDVSFSGAMRYENGAVAVVSSGFNAYTRIFSAIVGTQGALEVPATFQGTAGELTLTTAEGVKAVPVKESNRYVLEVEDFSEAILKCRSPLLDLGESLCNAEILERLGRATALDGRA